MKYKVLSLFITLTIIIGLISSIPIVTASNNSGTCGKIATWSFNYNTNTLTISGTGDMDNYIYNDDMPWHYLITYNVIDVVVINNGITNIGNYSFYNCDKLISVNIPNCVTNIGDRAFQGCKALTSVTIPEGVTSIGDNAFYYCTNLKSVTIPSSVTSIGKDVFVNCNNPVINAMPIVMQNNMLKPMA